MAWPIFQSMYPEPFANFAALCVNAGSIRDYRFHVAVRERTLLHEAMNQIASTVVNTPELDVLIVFDDDCRPPLDAIHRLLKHYEDGKEFVAGMGFMRNYPHETTVGRYYPEGQSLSVQANGEATFRSFQWLDDDSRLNGTVEADFCGFPIAMISKKLLKRIKEPWFGTQGKDGGSCTHDIYFCQKAQDAGAKIYVDTDIKCDHLAAAPWVTFDNRRRVREFVKQQEAEKA